MNFRRVLPGEIRLALAVACVTASFIAPTAAAARATTVALLRPSRSAQAPMDRYFGKLAMSPLGVLNTIQLVSDRADAKEIDSSSAASRLFFVEDSIRDWETRFPRDRWLPRTLVALKHVYHKFDDAAGHANEARVDTWLLLHHPASAEARAVIAQDQAKAQADVQARLTEAQAPPSTDTATPAITPVSLPTQNAPSDPKT